MRGGRDENRLCSAREGEHTRDLPSSLSASSAIDG